MVLFFWVHHFAKMLYFGTCHQMVQYLSWSYFISLIGVLRLRLFYLFLFFMNMIYLNKTSWNTLWLSKQGDHICTVISASFCIINNE